MEATLRKTVVAGAATLGLVLAGCGGPAAEESPPETTDIPQGSAAPSEDASQRGGPVKTMEVADKCSLLTPEQQADLGLSAEPKETEVDGNLGCQYRTAERGTPGVAPFVALNNETDFQMQADTMPEPKQTADLGGYPSLAQETAIGCVLYADISDDGVLYVSLLENDTEESGADLCGTAQQVAEAAIQNVPDA